MLRYLPVQDDDRYLGWYEPAHFVLEANAQLIARRFPDLAFAILTPDGSAHWDGAELRFAAGVSARRCRTTRRCNRGGTRITPRLLRDARVGTAIPEAEQLDEAPRPPDRPPLGPVVLPLHADPALQEATHEAAGLPSLPSL